MAKKFLSVIFVPHSKTGFKTIAFSKKSLKAAIGGSAVFLLLLVAFLVDYFSMGVIRQKYKALNREAAEQRERLAGYEAQVNRLRATVGNLESYAKKLNVMAGLKSPDIIGGGAGLGGGEPEPNGQAVAPPSPPSLPLNEVKDLNQKAQSVEGNLNTLVGYFEAQSVRLASTPSILPAAGWYNSPYGYRTDPITGLWTMHRGIDITTNTGNPIVATADGVVIRVTTDKYLGKNVTISHGFGMTTVYGHMSKFGCREGQKVKRGDVIGYIGKTGKASGPHVHYEVRIDNKAVNPYNYILEE